VHQANRPVIIDSIGIRFLPQQNHQRLIDEVKTSAVQGPKGIESSDYVSLDDGPSFFVKEPGEAIWTRRFLRRDVTDDGPNLFLGEADING
jgi:hypothetical protein